MIDSHLFPNRQSLAIHYLEICIQVVEVEVFFKKQVSSLNLFGDWDLIIEYQDLDIFNTNIISIFTGAKV